MRPSSSRKLRVLYVGTLGPTDTSTHRRWAIERLGHEVIEFDTSPYLYAGSPIVRALRWRTLVGLSVLKLNRDLLDAVSEHRPELIWFDKASYVYPRTVRNLRAQGIFTAHFNIDNPFGPRNDAGWRLILKALPEYDLHLVQRDINLVDYRRAGARDVMLMRTAYEPTLHFPPPEGWSDRDRLHDVVFIGAPYDQRYQFVRDLWYRYGIKVRIWGSPMWEGVLSAEDRELFWQGGELWNAAYRETIWKSRLCLSFVTHSNRDDVAHKSFEIAACGGCLLVEDTPGHRAHFEDAEEAIFFKSAEDCAMKIRQYLSDENVRSRIGIAARRRAEDSGYGNDARLEAVFKYILDGGLPKNQPAPGMREQKDDAPPEN